MFQPNILETCKRSGDAEAFFWAIFTRFRVVICQGENM